MHHAECVGFLQGIADRAPHRDHAPPRHRPLVGEALEQRLPVQQLHHDEQLAAGLLRELVRRDRVRAAQARERRALAAESRDHPRVRRQPGMQHLDGELHRRSHVHRAIDRPEATGRDARFDAVPPIEDGPDERVVASPDGEPVAISRFPCDPGSMTGRAPNSDGS